MPDPDVLFGGVLSGISLKNYFCVRLEGSSLSEQHADLDIVGTVYHLVIYIYAVQQDTQSVSMSEFIQHVC